MSATESTTDRTAIEATVQLYVEGASQGDAEKLREGFHESAWMFGSLAGQRYDMPVSDLADIVVAQPLDSDGSYRAEIVSVEQSEDAAVVVLDEHGCWGGISFRDYFTLTRIDGTWKIVNKTFAHTGGAPASS